MASNEGTNQAVSLASTVQSYGAKLINIGKSTSPSQRTRGLISITFPGDVKIVHSLPSPNTALIELLKTVPYVECKARVGANGVIILITINVTRSRWAAHLRPEELQGAAAALMAVIDADQAADISGSGNYRLDVGTLIPAVQLTRALGIPSFWERIPSDEQLRAASALWNAAKTAGYATDWALVLSVLQLPGFRHAYNSAVIYVAKTARVSCYALGEALVETSYLDENKALKWRLYRPQTPGVDWWTNGYLNDTTTIGETRRVALNEVLRTCEQALNEYAVRPLPCFTCNSLAVGMIHHGLREAGIWPLPKLDAINGPLHSIVAKLGAAAPPSTASVLCPSCSGETTQLSHGFRRLQSALKSVLEKMFVVQPNSRDDTI